MVCSIGLIKNSRNTKEPGSTTGRGKKSRNSAGKGNVDSLFWKRIKKLLGHVLTSWTGTEAQYIYVLTILLVVRTFMSIWLADVNGRVVGAIVNKSFPEFLQRIATLFLFAIPSSTINSALDYLQKKLSLAFRRRITAYFHNHYLRSMHYYKICNLDSRISNPDQRLTQDAEKWATSLSGLYVNLSKPVLDMFLFSRKLADLVGWQGPALTFAWYFFSGLVIKLISPPFGRLTAAEAKLEGEYRSLHTELLSHSEEIAFY